MKYQSEGSSTHYDDQFYSGQAPASYRSAAIYARHLWRYVQPRSVVDVGCGRGSWLKAFKELGSTQLTGVDGAWNSRDKMIDGAIEFIPSDLNAGIEIGRTFDLAVSLEVAEHLAPEVASSFVHTLTDLSEIVLFGAACPGQGGVAHINEQFPSWWAKKFAEKGYMAFDLFRPAFWGNGEVQFWYRQNTFLYVRSTSTTFSQMRAHGLSPMQDTAFMDCVHPELHARTIIRGQLGHRLRNVVRPFVPKSVLLAIGRLRQGTFR